MRATIIAVALAFASISATAKDADVVVPVERDAPLVLSARKNDSAATRELLAAQPRPDVNQRTADGTTALHWAVYHNDVDLVERLIAAGADPKLKNDYGATPLSEAAVVGNVQVIRKLLTAGADVESANADGQTAVGVGKYLTDNAYLGVDSTGRVSIDLDIGKGVKARGAVSATGGGEVGVFYENEY